MTIIYVLVFVFLYYYEYLIYVRHYNLTKTIIIIYI